MRVIDLIRVLSRLDPGLEVFVIETDDGRPEGCRAYLVAGAEEIPHPATGDMIVALDH